MFSVTAALRNALRILLPLSLLLTAYLYAYPVFNGCGFPTPSGNAFVETVKYHVLGSQPAGAAPFRLLALGDPQLEGDTSIPNADADSFPHLETILEYAKTDEYSLGERVRLILHNVIDFWFEDIPNTAGRLRKRLDLFGNDYYLAHIYRTVKWWSGPTHITVLGDLLGSQWVDDAEFERRAGRFWNRVVKGGERVEDEVALEPTDGQVVTAYLGDSKPSGGESTDGSTDNSPVVGSGSAGDWSRKIINVVGNHDIGYAGDITPERLSRFERLFGKANYELRFVIPAAALSPEAAASLYDETSNPDSDRVLPELRIVNLNDMNLDTPALSSDIQDSTYSFINGVINTAKPVETRGHFTVVLTHVPLYKPEGTCVDAPYFSFHEHDGTLKEQNQLSQDASKGFLEGIFGMHADSSAPGQGKGRNGVVLNGHDHEGCDTYHFVNQSRKTDDDTEAASWETVRWLAAQRDGIVGGDKLPGMREITVRSMMGDFGGNSGLFSAWFDEAAWEWKYEFATCPLGKQHFWWIVHVVDLIVVIGIGLYGLAVAVEGLLAGPSPVQQANGKVPDQKLSSADEKSKI